MSNLSTSPAIFYAGFWRRFVAMLIDYLLVSAALFALLALLALFVPTIANLIDLSTFRWMTVERTLESSPPKTIETGDQTKTETERIVESTVAGRWVYVHRVTEIVTEKKAASGAGTSHKPTKRFTRVRLDPATRAELKGISVLYYFWIPWLLYAVLMESSGLQATLGKMAMGLKVTTVEGASPSYVRSLLRNLLKVLSAIPVFIGFMMAGWTRRKQALHDMMARCLVISA